jgi:hypothetical protein
VPESEWSLAERKFMVLIRMLCRTAGYADVYLGEFKDDRTGGTFSIFEGRVVVNRIGVEMLAEVATNATTIHLPTDTVLHEAGGHLGETYFSDAARQAGHYQPGVEYSHDTKGGAFSRSMETAAAAALGTLGSRQQTVSNALASGKDTDAAQETSDEVAPGGLPSQETRQDPTNLKIFLGVNTQQSAGAVS